MTLEDPIMLHVSVDTVAKSFVVRLRDTDLPTYFLPGTAPTLTFSEIEVSGSLNVDFMGFAPAGN